MDVYAFLNFARQRSVRFLKREFPSAEVSIPASYSYPFIEYIKKGYEYVEFGRHPSWHGKSYRKHELPDEKKEAAAAPTEEEKGAETEEEKGAETEEENDVETEEEKDEEEEKEKALVVYPKRDMRLFSMQDIRMLARIENFWVCGPHHPTKVSVVKEWIKARGLSWWLKDPREVRWDGYNGEDAVIIDGLEPTMEHSVRGLSTWANFFPFEAETSSASLCIRPKHIIVTSTYTPEDFFKTQFGVLDIYLRFTVNKLAN